jgi:hypothetical protein
MNTIKLSARWVRTGIAAMALAAFVAACGSSSPSNSSTTTSASAGSKTSRTALAACLKQHGVSLPTNGFRPGSGGPPTGGSGSSGPPPGGAPSGSGVPGGGGGFRSNAKFQAALKACGANFPAGGAGGFRGRPGGTFSHTAIDKYVACVRNRGYDLPNPNFSGKGSIFPAKIRSNTKFQAASKACASDLRPAVTAGSGSSSN